LVLLRDAIARTMLSQDVCLSVCSSVCPSQAGIVLKRLYIYHQTVFTVGSHNILVFFIPNGTPTGASKTAVQQIHNRID